MLAVLHGLERHRHVPLPRGGHIDDVDIIARDHLFPDVLVAEVHRGLLAGDLFHVGGGALGAGFDDIANGDDFGERDVCGGVHVTAATAKADDGDSHLFGWLGRQLPDGLIASWAGTRGRDIARAEEFEVARVGLGIGGRDGAEAETKAGEGTEFKEVATMGVFGEVHGGGGFSGGRLAVGGWEIRQRWGMVG